MSETPPQEPYDWSKAIDGDKPKRRARMSEQSFSSQVDQREKARFKIGFLGWLMVLTTFVIIAGGVVLAWMSWSFQSSSQRVANDDQGLVPASRDFAPNGPKAADVLFRIAGSAKLGEKLMPDLVANWMRAQGYGGVSASEDGRIVTIRGTKGGKDARVLIVKGSANGGFDALINARVEAVMSARPILPQEADRLSALGDMTSVDNEKIIGLSAEYVLVNRANPLNDINTDTLGRVFAGEILNWSDVVQNGDGVINVKVTKSGGDFQATAIGQLLGDRELPENVDQLANNDDVADEIGRNSAAIGTSDKIASGTKALSVNERNARTISANPFDISTESYPFSKRIHIYVGASGVDPIAQNFANYAMSAAGQEIVARTGFIPLKLAPAKVVVPVGAPRDYQSFARDAQRMNFDLRFHQGANELDSRAQEDIKRFAAYLAANKIDKRRVALLGFADNVGARATNLGLSQSRAESVGIAMERAGITPGIIRAYGDAMPVGANAEEKGRIKNRRVEVWLCAPPACPLVDLVSQVSAATREIPTGVRLGTPRKPLEGEEAPKG